MSPTTTTPTHLSEPPPGDESSAALETIDLPEGRVQLAHPSVDHLEALFVPYGRDCPVSSATFLLDPMHVVIGRIQSDQWSRRRGYASILLRCLARYYKRKVIPYMVDATESSAIAFWDRLRETADFVDPSVPWPLTTGTESDYDGEWASI